MLFETYSYESMSSLAKSELFSYRYKVFVDILGWDLDTPQGIEVDQFDSSAAHYIISRDDGGNIVGCARLLPTTQPYLLSDVFPELLSETDPPASPRIWELSRFTTIDVNAYQSNMNPRAYSKVTRDLLDECLRCAKQNGVKQLVTVSPIGIERLVRIMGYEVSRMGPVIDYDGHIIVACNQQGMRV